MPKPKAPLPKDLATWQEAVRLEKIGDRPLACIADDRPFSGSTILYKAFLQLRAVWPRTLEFDEAAMALQHAGIFSHKDAKLASGLIDKASISRRGLAKLDAFLDLVVIDALPRTPPSVDVCSGDACGSFAPSLHLLNSILPRKSGLLDPKSREEYTSKIEMSPGVPKLDWQKPSVLLKTPGVSPGTEQRNIGETELESSFVESFNDLKLEASPSIQAYQRKNAKQGGSTKGRTASYDSGEITALLNPDISRTEMRFRGSRFLLGRTEYEVQTSTFFFSFITALQTQIFPFSRSPSVYAIPSETRYKFGTASIPPIAAAVPTKIGCDCLYIACPDGAFIRKDHLGFEHRFAYIEIKPFRRKGIHAIAMEETAEIAAILSEEIMLKQDGKGKTLQGAPISQSKKDTQFKLMISFDRDEFWFVLVKFTERYLNYIANSENTTIPQDPGIIIEESDLAQFQLIGPFPLEAHDEMVEFSRLILSIIFTEMEKTGIGKTQMDALRKHVEASKDL